MPRISTEAEAVALARAIFGALPPGTAHAVKSIEVFSSRTGAHIKIVVHCLPQASKNLEEPPPWIIPIDRV